MRHIARSLNETKQIARKLGAQICAHRSRKARVIAFFGELGAGKTTFVKYFAKALGVRERLTSPTFVIYKKYRAAPPYAHFVHMDAYRLNSAKDLNAIGGRKLLEEPSTVVAIEWPERIAGVLPQQHVSVHIDHIGPRARAILICGL